MGSITKRKKKYGYSYRAQVMVRGQRETKTFDDEIQARIWMRDKEKSLATGEPLDGEVPKGDMLIFEAMERFIIESRAIRSRAQIASYHTTEKQFRKVFSERTRMSEITHQDMSAHVLKRMTEDGVGPTSIKNELSFIRGVYQKAVDWGVNIPSPELSIKRPRPKMQSREDRLDKIIKTDELAEIFRRAKRARNNLYLYLKFLLYTGMRPSEAAELYWERLKKSDEAEAERKNLPTGFVDLKRGGFSKIGTKTATRFVPGHAEAVKIIETLAEDRPPGKKLVFLDDKYINRFRAYTFYRRSFCTVKKNSRPDEKDLRSAINFYSFRHTFRSRLEECGVSTATAETIIGHSDQSSKFTYIHLSDEALIAAIKMLDFGIDM